MTVKDHTLMNRARTAAATLAAAAAIAPAMIGQATPAHATVSPYAPGTRISHTTSQQVMIATRTHGTHGTWVRYQWTGDRTGWRKVSTGHTDSVFGLHGTAPASTRRQGDGKTPTGTFRIAYTFGNHNPGTRMTYRTIDSCSWFVENPSQRDYNRWRETCHASSSLGEHMADYKNYQYRQGAVIEFNYTHPKHTGAGSGAGIFLHYARSYTEGCVGLDNLTELTSTIKWLDPAKHPTIVIK